MYYVLVEAIQASSVSINENYRAHKYGELPSQHTHM